MNQKISLIEKAARIALVAHAKQKRKSDVSPYIVHPIMVALRLARYGFSELVITAALVHDVLEDTDFPEEKLCNELGEEILKIVKAITEDKSLPWEERKQKFIEAVQNSSDDVKAVSVADKIHNLESLLAAHAQLGPELWKKFNRGKEKKIWFENEILKIFKKTWQHPLVEEYEILLKQARNLE